MLPWGRGRVRPSRAISWISIPVGIAFTGLGIWLAFTIGPFGWLFALVSASLLAYHVVNVARPSGAAMYEIDATPAGPAASPEERLRRLEKMRADRLVSETEYQEKRREILRDL